MPNSRSVLLWLGGVFLVVQVALALWPAALGGLHWLPAAVLYLPPLAPAVVSFILLLASARLKCGRLGLLAVASFALVLACHLSFTPSSQTPPAAIRVLSWNINYAADYRAIIPYLRSIDPDLMLLQECNNYNVRLTEAAFSDYETVFDHGRDVAIWSRLPVVARLGEISGLERTVGVKIDHQGTEINVYSVYIGKADRRPGRLPPLKATLEAHREAALDLGRVLTADNLILGGDFNAPPGSPLVRRLSLTDAFRQGGNGFGLTFPALFPLWRVDHILTGDELNCRRVSVLPTDLSDHRPVIAHLSLSKQ